MEVMLNLKNMKMDLYFLSMGQNMLIEPLQALNITNTILNNGIYTKLKLIDKIVNENNEVIKEFSNTSDKVLKKILQIY